MPAQRPLLSRRVLDEQMATSRSADPTHWGVWPWAGPVMVLAALIVAGQVLIRAIDPQSLSTTARAVVGVALTLGPELVLLAACLAFAYPIVRRGGGWSAAFGAGWVRGGDWAAYGLGVAGVFLARIVLGELAQALTGGAAARQAQNLTLARHPSVLAIAVLALTAAVLAPVTEELMFRGLLLRTFMRRMGFWPAAATSTAIFAAFHVYEVRTVLGAVFLAASILILGGVNTYLVRITGRLAPGVLVHATVNLLAVLVVIGQAAR